MGMISGSPGKWSTLIAACLSCKEHLLPLAILFQSLPHLNHTHHYYNNSRLPILMWTTDPKYFCPVIVQSAVARGVTCSELHVLVCCR